MKIFIKVFEFGSVCVASVSVWFVFFSGMHSVTKACLSVRLLPMYGFFVFRSFFFLMAVLRRSVVF